MIPAKLTLMSPNMAYEPWVDIRRCWSTARAIFVDVDETACPKALTIIMVSWWALFEYIIRMIRHRKVGLIVIGETTGRIGIGFKKVVAITHVTQFLFPIVLLRRLS